MKPSHRKDVIIARIIFAVICVAIIGVFASIIVVIASHSKSNTKEPETQTESQTDDKNNSYVPNDTQTVDTDIYYKTTASVNLRQEPNTESAVVTTLPENVDVKYISEDNGWTQVEYEGQNGYVKSDFLTQPQPADGTGTEAVPEDTQQPAEDTQQTGSTTKNNYVVVLDPGHQAKGESSTEPNGPGSSTMKARVTGGTKGTTTGVYEYELTLDIAKQLKSELENRGYTVYMTRDSHDVKISNKERAEYATSVKANISVRLHANGTDSSSVSGALALTPSSSNAYVANLADDSYKLSMNILDSYCKETGMKNQGVLANDTMTGINWSTVPVTILEMGYMTNPTDDSNMEDSSYQQKMVTGIANGIDAYFGVSNSKSEA